MILAVRLKNAIRAAFGNVEDLEFQLRNIVVNGQKRGCSGFVRNKSNNAVVYINTEPTTYGALPPYMYRYADDMSDFRGYRNRFAETLNELAAEVAKMLLTPVKETKEPKI